jgi:hypothetical protein
VNEQYRTKTKKNGSRRKEASNKLEEVSMLHKVVSHADNFTQFYIAAKQAKQHEGNKY